MRCVKVSRHSMMKNKIESGVQVPAAQSVLRGDVVFGGHRTLAVARIDGSAVAANQNWLGRGVYTYPAHGPAQQLVTEQ